jgi:transcriptional regulator with XRE-family HTH domain
MRHPRCVSEEGTGRESVIAERLNRLWEAHRPGSPPSLQEVAEGINADAGRRIVVPQYLSMLRRGQRTEPGFSVLAALAKYFGVTVDYFTADDETAKRTEDELRLLHALRDEGVRRIALCAADLSAADLEQILGIVRRFRVAEGLPEEPTI